MGARHESDQAKRSNALGMVTAWPVWHYEIVGDRIRRRPETKRDVRVTSPGALVELPAEIARLRSQDPADALRFANLYGLLAPDVRTQSERLVDIWRRAIRMDTTLRLAKLAQRSSTKTATFQVLRTENAALQSTGLEGSHESVLRMMAERKVGDVLATRLSGALQRLRLVFLNRRMMFQATTLDDVAYWQLAEALTGRKRLRRCEWCETIFVVNHQRRRHCPATPGRDCGAAARQQRKRRRNPSDTRLQSFTTRSSRGVPWSPRR